MKKLILLLGFSVCGFAQTYNLGVVYTTSTPSGACTLRSTLVWVEPSGDLYGCDGGTYALIASGGGGGGGTVTSVGFSTNLGTAGGTPVTGSGTLTLSVSASDIVGKFSGCSGTDYLGADGACHTPGGGGTVTSIATTSPISGGTITTTGTISCPTCVTTSNTGLWTVATNDIYNSNSGNVGIAGAPPASHLFNVTGTVANGTNPIISATNSSQSVDIFQVQFEGAVNTNVAQRVGAPSGNYYSIMQINSGGGGGSGDDSILRFGQSSTSKWDVTGVWNGSTSFGIRNTTDSASRFTLSRSAETANFYQTAVVGWSSSGDADNAADTALARNAAGVVELNNGTAGTYRDLKLRNSTYTGYSDLTAIAAPSNPSAGSIRVYADSGTGNLTCLTSAGGNCLPGSGTVTTTGSPANGNLTKFSGASSITNGDLSGDVTTSGTLTTTVGKVNGISYSATAAAHSVEVITTANTTATAKVIPDCTDTGGNHLNFTQSTDAFSCGTSGSGGATTSQGTYASIPATCTTNNLYLTTDSYYDMLRCSATNTWSYFLRGKLITLPGAASGYTVINGGSGSAAVADSVGGVKLSTTSNVVGLEAAVKAVPAAPYTKTIVLSASAFRPGSGTSNVGCGVMWTNGTTTASSVQWLRVLAENSGVSTYSTQVVRYTSFAFAGGAADANYIGTVLTGEYLYMRLDDNNTNRIFSISGDGVNFVQVYSVTRTSPFTPTHYGFGCGVQNSGTGQPWMVTDLGEL